ncbi:inosine/xanthosine triphosphatase [Candidatus Woesearchaeota archaeon]|nr:inosine/xanthosine triphosphatase [Candidatus Woesearchaeota archaeon]MBI2581575.1 inosine/xanthosine triphosphatase [Candidatus Woesearchaeota archaeon]
MKIVVGSTNPSKLDAVKEVLSMYSFWGNAEIVGVSANSEVSDQPKTSAETIWGAINRARHAYQAGGCNYAVGLESGFHEFPHAGHMEFTACVIYDGRDNHFGFSSAFKCPDAVYQIMQKDGLNLNDACYKAGLTQNPEIGKSEGIIGILTKGRKTRKDYTKDAIIMAMIHVENKF